MINAAMIGLGWWGQTLVEAVEDSDVMKFVACSTRTRSDDAVAFADQHGMEFAQSYEEILANPAIDAVVLATPHSMHVPQIKAAAAAGKHIFCEKPFALEGAEAAEAIAAVEAAGVTLALGYNRRFHPTMIDLKERIDTGALGTILHFEGTMSFPNSLFQTKDQWRANSHETPCGGLTPMGVHIIDAVIDLFGEVDHVFCQSVRRVVEVDNDDTTSVLFRMKQGITGYLATMTATGGSFRFQVYGSKGWLRVDGMSHVAGAPSEERRSKLFGACTFQPVKGPQENWQAESQDVSRAALEAFAVAASGGKPFPITYDQMVHGAAVTETIVRSAASGVTEKIS